MKTTAPELAVALAEQFIDGNRKHVMDLLDKLAPGQAAAVAIGLQVNLRKVAPREADVFSNMLCNRAGDIALED